MSKIHELKIAPEYFNSVISQGKNVLNFVSMTAIILAVIFSGCMNGNR